MNSIAAAALSSWTVNPAVLSVLLIAAAVYLRGWLRGRAILAEATDPQRLLAFFAGLAAVFLATESPLDTFDSLFLSAHMTQHLLLMMIAPPLILLGHPMLPLLRGLPKSFVKEGLGPFLTWPLLQRVFTALTSPPVALTLFVLSTIAWHLPQFYQLALNSYWWHGAQHACFFWTGLLFWWSVVEPGPRKSKWPLWSKVPYLLFGDIVNTILSAMFVFSGRLLYPHYEAVRASSFTAQEDQTIAGLIMWVPGSIVYLVPAFLIAMQLLLPARPGVKPVRPRTRVKRRTRLGRKSLSLPRLRPAVQAIMLLIAVLVMADGWFGPQATSLNLAGVLPWIHWRGLSILALLAVGNLFCMACPFVLVRDLGRRFLPARMRWPRALRNKWLPAALFILYLWAYEAFNLWDSPMLTAWIIASYFLAALAVDGFFRGASFCKYVCPIGQFHFVSSLVSPREVTIKSAATCQSCRTFDCIRGNQQARGCELDLFQPKKASNLDCTFCLDCVKACPHDNVAILPVMPASTLAQDPYRSSIGRLSKRSDIALLALVFVFGAFANAAGMTAPIMMWEHVWHARLGTYGMPVIVAGFTLACVLIVPASLLSICRALNRAAGVSPEGVARQSRRLLLTLVPLGFTMWAAHLAYHLGTSWGAAWPIVEQRFLGLMGQVAMPMIPAWLTPLQILLLDAGLLLTLYAGWRVVRQSAGKVRVAVALLSPWAAVSLGLYAAGLWILFQPMPMRGMMQ